MNLVFDLGNTRVKGAVFENDNIVEHFVIDYPEIENLQKKIDFDSIDRIGLSSVSHAPQSFFQWLNQLDIPLLTLNETTPLPIEISYKNPETLGNDRICNAVAGRDCFPGNNVLIVDLGTCNKYDFIDKKGCYLGGSIAPGYKMRYDAMHKFTAQLPLLAPNVPSGFIGKSTKTSMETGVFWGMAGEINYLIGQYILQFNDLKIILTGGYQNDFVNMVKKSIFADPYLTLKGLNSILNYQYNS